MGPFNTLRAKLCDRVHCKNSFCWLENPSCWYLNMTFQFVGAAGKQSIGKVTGVTYAVRIYPRLWGVYLVSVSRCIVVGAVAVDGSLAGVWSVQVRGSRGEKRPLGILLKTPMAAHGSLAGVSLVHAQGRQRKEESGGHNQQLQRHSMFHVRQRPRTHPDIVPGLPAEETTRRQLETILHLNPKTHWGPPSWRCKMMRTFTRED